MEYSIVTPEKIAAATDVAKRIEIVSIRMIGAMAHNLELDRSIPTQLILETASRGRQLTPTQIAIEVFFQFSAFKNVEIPLPENAPLYISAKFEITYNLKETGELALNDLSAFGQINGVHNAWPYWREYVQSTLARMGLPAYALPVLPVSTISYTDDEPESPGFASARPLRDKKLARQKRKNGAKSLPK